jgi:hypothetical protein
MPQILPILRDCFRSPDLLLGNTERNTEIKIAFLTLWELGWDPANQVAMGFHIGTQNFTCPTDGATGAAKPADFATGSKSELCVVGEVKAWCEWDLRKYLSQVWGYQWALEFPRAFLTNGHQWMVWDFSGRCVEPKPVLDREFDSPDDMISTLRPILSPGSVTCRQIDPAAKANDWVYGIRRKWPKRQ